MTTTKDFNQVKLEVKSLVAEISEIPEEDIQDSARFAEDLGVDSMMALEIVASIEKKYKIKIKEDDIPKITSLQNVYDLLSEQLG